MLCLVLGLSWVGMDRYIYMMCTWLHFCFTFHSLSFFCFFDGLELAFFSLRSSRSDRSASLTRSLLSSCHATFCVLLFSLLFDGLNGPDGLLSFFPFCELSLRTQLLDSVSVFVSVSGLRFLSLSYVRVSATPCLVSYRVSYLRTFGLFVRSPSRFSPSVFELVLSSLRWVPTTYTGWPWRRLSCRLPHPSSFLFVVLTRLRVDSVQIRIRLGGCDWLWIVFWF